MEVLSKSTLSIILVFVHLDIPHGFNKNTLQTLFHTSHYYRLFGIPAAEIPDRFFIIRRRKNDNPDFRTRLLQNAVEGPSLRMLPVIEHIVLSMPQSRPHRVRSCVPDGKLHYGAGRSTRGTRTPRPSAKVWFSCGRSRAGRGGLPTWQDQE
jgi:hypothetical protein